MVAAFLLLATACTAGGPAETSTPTSAAVTSSTVASAVTDGAGPAASSWLPEVPHSDEVTLGQLAQMTSGIEDYVQQPAFLQALLADPFRQWTPEELIAQVAELPLIYPPGTNWNYSHTNYVLLGLALETITGKPVAELLAEKVLEPLGLTNTVGHSTPEIPAPVLHAFSSERREYFGVPAGQEFYEESSFWNPSWTITAGAIQTGRPAADEEVTTIRVRKSANPGRSTACEAPHRRIRHLLGPTGVIHSADTKARRSSKEP